MSTAASQNSLGEVAFPIAAADDGIGLIAILGESVAIYGRHWLAWLGLSSIVVLSAALAMSFVIAVYQLWPAIGILAGAGSIGGLLILVGAIQGIFVFAVSDARESQEPISIDACYRRARPFTGRVVATAFFSAAGITIATLAYVIPGVVLATCWFVVLPIVVLEGEAGGEIFQRSLTLVKGNSFQIGSLAALTMMIQAAGRLLTDPLRAISPPGLPWTGTIVLNILVMPFLLILPSVTYFWLRRKEWNAGE